MPRRNRKQLLLVDEAYEYTLRRELYRRLERELHAAWREHKIDGEFTRGHTLPFGVVKCVLMLAK